jgi:hypothetical protein
VLFRSFFLRRDHAEQSRLAGAVRANQAHLLAGVQLKRSIDKNQLLAVLLIDIGKRDHYSIISESFNTVAQFLAVQMVESFESK